MRGHGHRGGHGGGLFAVVFALSGMWVILAMVAAVAQLFQLGTPKKKHTFSVCDITDEEFAEWQRLVRRNNGDATAYLRSRGYPA